MMVPLYHHAWLCGAMTQTQSPLHLPTEVHPSALGDYKKMSVPLELGSQVVVHCPGVSNLILSLVTKFQPYELLFSSCKRVLSYFRSLQLVLPSVHRVSGL